MEQEDWKAIRKSVLFQGIQESELQALLACLNGREAQYAKGEWLLMAGDEVKQVGLILRGQASVERIDYDGTRHIVHALLPGDLFGESYAAVSDSIAQVGVQAETEVRVLYLQLDRILHMCSSACTFHTRLITNLVAFLARRNIQLNEKLSYVTRRTLKEKVLAYLYGEALRQNSACFDIPFDRQGLADYLNADRSALSSVLSGLKKEGLLDYAKNHFHLLKFNPVQR